MGSGRVVAMKNREGESIRSLVVALAVLCSTVAVARFSLANVREKVPPQYIPI